MSLTQSAKKHPLLVNINGAAHIGVTTACQRVAMCLNAQAISTEVINVRRGIEAVEFKDDYILDKYKHLDVILLDRHHYTASAIKRRLHQPLWVCQEESVMPSLSVLLSCHGTVYKRFIKSNEDKRTALGHHDAYLSCRREHYGTPNHHVIDIDGKHGQLYAAGTIRSLILRELQR